MKKRHKEEIEGHADPIIKCDDVQSVLMEYAARELGESRSALVREHLLYCDDCKESFNDIMLTISALEGASVSADALPTQLSEKHYARIIRVLTHPILDWITVHHRLVAAIATALVLAGTLSALYRMKIVQIEKIEDMGYEIYINVRPNSGGAEGGPVIIWKAEEEDVDE